MVIVVCVIRIGVLKVNGAMPFRFLEFWRAQSMRHLLKSVVFGIVTVCSHTALAGGLPESGSGSGSGSGTGSARLVGALVGPRRHSRSVFVALRVSVLLAACTRAAWAVLEPDCGCAQLQHVLTHLSWCRCAWRCAMLGPLRLWGLGDSLRLWCWAGWSCGRKPHEKCLK